MQSDKKKVDKENERIIDSYDYMASAASMQDCTGLIPANPLPGEIMEAYEDIYPYEPPQVPSRKVPEDI